MSTSFNAIDAWAIKRSLNGHTLNGELAAVSEPWRPVGALLDTLAPTERPPAWEGVLCLRPDNQAIRQAVLDADPTAPMPTVSTARRFATLADVARIASATRWLWEGWIPDSSPFGIAAPEGTGKTRFQMDLARRIYHGLEWPDGQPMTLPAGSCTLWICADGHQLELLDTAAEMGIPHDAIVFPALEDEPYLNTSLDDPETWQWIDEAIATCRPALTFIDTLTYATTMNLCEQSTIAKIKGPLVDLCQKHQTNIGLSLHVSKEGHALGRRIKGITRTLVHLECPDPENPGPLRLWVEKTWGVKPEPLGCTLQTDGNVYTSNAPPRAARNAGGRPAKGREDAKQFIRDELARQNDQIGNDLCAAWNGGSRDTFWRAVREMARDGDLVTTGGKGTRQQEVLHLNDTTQSP